MSLYVYVSGREGLPQAMLDRVTATIELESPDPSRWRAQLHSLLQRTHQALIAHPGIAVITLADSTHDRSGSASYRESPGNPARRRAPPPRRRLGMRHLRVAGDRRRQCGPGDDALAAATTATAKSKSTSYTKPSPPSRPTGSLCSPPTPRDGRRGWRRAVSLRHRRCIDGVLARAAQQYPHPRLPGETSSTSGSPGTCSLSTRSARSDAPEVLSRPERATGQPDRLGGGRQPG